MMRSHIPALILAAGLITAAPACATTYGYGYGDHRDDVQRRAYDRGYHEGTEDGRNDARKGRPADYRRHDEFRDADEGYHRNDGDREFYREVFRRGYVAGYDAAYRVNGGYGRRDDDDRGYAPPYPQANTYPAYPNAPAYPYPPYSGERQPAGGYYTPSSPAAQSGYRDGLKAGQEDARHGDRFDPSRAHDYRDGDHDYDRRYGSRDDYMREYRAAFEQGYRVGYGQR